METESLKDVLYPDTSEKKKEDAWLNWIYPFCIHIVTATFTDLPIEMVEYFTDYTFEYLQEGIKESFYPMETKK